MDYKEKYEQALEKMKAWAEGKYPECFDSAQKTAELIFPELKESEDEKIRKAIIEFFELQDDNTTYSFIPKKDILAWLQKQGEKFIPEDINEAALQYVDNCSVDGEVTHDNVIEPYWNNHSMMNAYKAGWLKSQHEQNTIDKVERKFKVEKDKWYVCIKSFALRGDIVVIKGQIYQSNQNDAIEGEDKHLFIDTHDGKASDYFRFWTIQDAKDGDVLYSLDSNQPFIYKERKPFEQATAYCGINKYGKFFVWNTKDCIIVFNKYVPATKEQRDLLFHKMKEAGYEWDVNEKKLKKIEQEYHCTGVREPKEATGVLKQLLVEQKSNCSEEALQYLREHHSPSEMSDFQAAMNIAVANAYDKGKADAINTMKPEWSEEDENRFEEAIDMIESNGNWVRSKDAVKQISSWLNSLKDKYIWKPNEEQMDCLNSILRFGNVSQNSYKHLNSLINDLKKLKG